MNKVSLLSSKTSLLAIISLVIAIMTLGLFWIPFFGLFMVVLTLVLGFVANRRIHKKHLGGSGLTIVAIVIGFLLIIPSFIFTILTFALLGATVEGTVEEGEIEIVSTSFSDFGDTWCDFETTELKKEDLFNNQFKNQYVTWTGKVATVEESGSSYNLKVIHCGGGMSDMKVKMKADQKDKLLELEPWDEVTYTAKLKSASYGLLQSMTAENGEIIS
ncbi:MAG: DUF4190 domain-containing protein [archaeon]